MTINISQVFEHYVIAALWSSMDDDGLPLDANYSAGGIAPATLATMRADCEDFCSENAELLGLFAELLPQTSGYSAEAQIGHDLWLTRNRHGAGFLFCRVAQFVVLKNFSFDNFRHDLYPQGNSDFVADGEAGKHDSDDK